MFLILCIVSLISCLQFHCGCVILCISKTKIDLTYELTFENDSHLSEFYCISQPSSWFLNKDSQATSQHPIFEDLCALEVKNRIQNNCPGGHERSEGVHHCCRQDNHLSLEKCEWTIECWNYKLAKRHPKTSVNQNFQQFIEIS